jgi:hypothetical protein
VIEAAVGESAIPIVPKESTNAIGDVWWTRVGGAPRSQSPGRRGSTRAFVRPPAVSTVAAACWSVEEVANFSLRHGRNESPEAFCQFKIAVFLAMMFGMAGSEVQKTGTASLVTISEPDSGKPGSPSSESAEITDRVHQTKKG